MKKSLFLLLFALISGSIGLFANNNSGPKKSPFDYDTVVTSETVTGILGGVISRGKSITHNGMPVLGMEALYCLLPGSNSYVPTMRRIQVIALLACCSWYLLRPVSKDEQSVTLENAVTKDLSEASAVKVDLNVEGTAQESSRSE